MKLTLDAEDAARFALDCGAAEKDPRAVRRALRRILAAARNGSDDGADPARYFVQIFEDRRGGCELFVTRLGQAADDPAGREACYAFGALEDMLLACRRLTGNGVRKGNAYADPEGGRYYLILPSPAPILAEYNAVRCADGESAYITEACRFLCADAPARLAPLA